MRKCKHCKKKVNEKTALRHNLNIFCNWTCVFSYTKSEQGRKAGEKVLRKDLQRRKDDIKTIPTRLAEAQTAFNAYIRVRDKYKPCVSCGKPPSPHGRGGGTDASHYLPRGSAKGGSFRRYDPNNIFSACKHCNRYLSGNLVPYRVELIKRIGIERVEKIEATNEIKKWNHTDLRKLKKLYQRKKRIYEKLFRKDREQYERKLAYRKTLEQFKRQEGKRHSERANITTKFRNESIKYHTSTRWRYWDKNEECIGVDE